MRRRGVDLKAVTSGSWSYRSRSNAVFGAMAALVLIGWAWAALEAGGTALLLQLPWIAAAAVGTWLAFGRPHVTVHDDGVTLVNPLRTVEVPWAALIDVSTQFALTLRTPRGKYAAWAAPGPGRHAATQSVASDVTAVAKGRGAVAIGDLPTAPSGVVAFQVRTRWQRLVESGALEAGVADQVPVRVTIAWAWVAALGGCVLLGVVAVLVS